MNYLIADIQLAFSDLIRIIDLVVSEDELGRIGENHMTCVVVRNCQERRLVAPVSNFSTPASGT